MKIRSDHQRRMYETIDREIMEEIEIKFENDPETQTKLKDLWISDCQEQEKNLTKLLEQKRFFLETWNLMTQKKRIQEMTEVQQQAKYNIKRITSPTSSKYQDNIMETWLERKHHKNTSQGNRNRFQQEGANYNRNQNCFGNLFL